MPSIRRVFLTSIFVLACFVAPAMNAAQGTEPGTERQFTESVRPFLATYCASCHGATGQGDGPAAPFLTPRPRDFTSGRYKLRTTESGNVPTDDDLERSVREGMPGSAMPAWKGLLSDADIDSVLGYLKSLSPAFASRRSFSVPIISSGSPKPGPLFAFTSQNTSRRPRRMTRSSSYPPAQTFAPIRR